MDNPQKTYLKTSEVLQLVPFSRTTLFKLVEQHKFPQPFKPSERMHLWLKTEVIQWCNDALEGVEHA